MTVSYRLLPSLASPGIRLTSSTTACRFWAPRAAFQVPLTPPPLADTVIDWPGCRGWFIVSEKLTAAPLIRNDTPCTTPAGLVAVPWFLIVAENRTALPAPALAGDQVTEVTTRSGRPVIGPTVSCLSRVLLASLDSPIRLTSSTNACTVCGPAVAGHDPAVPPPFAVRVTDAPAASDAVRVSENVLLTPSTLNSTPCTTPAGVAASPWFFTVAPKRTGAPTAGLAGVQVTAVTTRSGLPAAA